MSIADPQTTSLYPRPTGLRMSYEDFLQLGEEYRHSEWVDGEVVMMAAVTDEHALTVSWLSRLLGVYCEAKKLGQVLGEPFQMKLVASARSGRAPDLMVVLTASLPRVQSKCLDGPADLVVEVSSPGTRRVDRVDKFTEYERGGVGEYWIIDPYRKLAEFHRLRDGRLEEHEPDEQGVYHSSTVTGFYLKPQWLWQRPLPTTISILQEMRVI